MLRVEVGKLKNILSQNVETLIVTHKNADPDAAASTMGFYMLLVEHLNLEKVSIAFPEGPSKVSKRALEHYFHDIRYLREWSGESYDIIVVVDTGSIEQLGSFQEALGKCRYLLIIDHHKPSESLHNRAHLRILDEKATSTVEIVDKIFDKFKYKPPPKLASLMLLGLMFDTKHFQIASARAFKTAYKLRILGGDLSEILEVVRVEPEVSEKIARLKAAQRAQIFRVGDWIIALTSVGAYEASAARGLLDLGADVAFVASEDGKVRVSGRARERFVRELGIHLGRDVMQVLEGRFGGSGGGHAIAGGYEGEAPVELVLKEIYEVLKRLIEEKAYGSSKG